MQKKIIRMLTVLLVFVMAFAMPMEASAATKKVTAATSIKKAKNVKAGKTTVTAKKKKNTYVKFTATKTKTYKFTIKNLRTPGKTSAESNIGAYACFYKNTDESEIILRQNGSNVEALWLHSAYGKSYGQKTAYAQLTSRTASIKLNKGETVYIGFIYNFSNKCKYDLIIK